MFISSNEVESVIGKELAVRLCEWLRNFTPVTCVEEQENAVSFRFNIDEALEFAMIKMKQDAFKKEFFPHFVKLKQYKVNAPAVRQAI